MVGEIDCRVDEGILSYALSRDKDAKEVAVTTARGYVTHLAELVGKHQHQLAICNVPPVSKEVPKEHTSVLMGVIETFNATLAEECKRHDVLLVDVYHYTKENAHIDHCHIKPRYVKQAIEAAWA